MIFNESDKINLNKTSESERLKLSHVISDQLHSSLRKCSPACMLFSFEGNLTICEDERNIVEITFKTKKKDFYLNPDNLPLEYFSYVIVETEGGGYDIGIVSELEKLSRIKRKNLGLYHEPLKRIISFAGDEDLKLLANQRKEEDAAKEVFIAAVTKNNLELKLIDIEFQFDRNKLTFYFTSEGRVDFRQLVKELAGKYRTRIELKQIGARDGVKKFGALASCGRELCCCTFLDDIKRVTVHDIKDQRQFVTANKLNGHCGRLKCCMSFENELYFEAIQKFPELQSIVKTKKGEAYVESIDIYNDLIYLYYPKLDSKESLKLKEFESITLHKRK